MLIADSQVHIWGNEAPDRPWLANGAQRLKHMGHVPELGAEPLLALMDAAGVDRAVIVPPTWDLDRIDLGVAAQAAHPDRFRVMMRIPVNRPDQAKAMLDEWRGHPAIAGVRLTFSFEGERDWMTDGTADWFWPYAERHDIATMLLVPHAKQKVAEIARRHPGLRLTIDHMGVLGNTADDAIAPYIEATAALAALPNISVKLSNLPSFSSAPFPYHNIESYIKILVGAFGARRCFWGTDLSRMMGKYGVGYREAIDHVTAHLAFLTEADKPLIMGGALCDWLRWPYSMKNDEGHA
ncbi:MAG: amidohydrolase [Pseudolabrys sp.]|nr:amidohydrolase [Pseudolabrys sp.]